MAALDSVSAALRVSPTLCTQLSGLAVARADERCRGQAQIVQPSDHYLFGRSGNGRRTYARATCGMLT